MTALATSLVRGACPGALAPMESGDGLIVRVRPRAATLKLGDVRAIAEAARACGNSHIDFTRRANLQIRGVTPATLEALQARLDAAGLLDATAEAEAVRNIVTSPLAGIDPTELLDVRGIAHELERLLAAEPTAVRLPTKFGFLVDGGGALPLDGERADIHLKAVAADKIAVGIDRADGVAWLGAVGPDEAAAAAVRVALAFLAARTGARVRMRDLGEGIVTKLASGFCAPLTPPCSGNGDRVGMQHHDGRVFSVGMAARFGRVEADALVALADAATAAGADELRISPWRTLYIGVSDEAAAAQLLATAREADFIVEASDPMLAIQACPGAPACRSAAADTRAAARMLAPLLASIPGVRTVHVSGCAKGCACSTPCDLVLVGTEQGFGLVRNGRADTAPEAILAAADLLRLPSMLASLAGRPRHA